MISHKQMVANQSNALKSTGPRTVEGKAIVCQNAVKHGILCQEIPIDENERVSFDEFSSRLFLELNPIGEFEHFIVDRIICSAWRLRRVIHIETAFYRAELNPTLIVDEKPSISDAFRGPSKDRMVVLSRYEIAIERSLYKAFEELMRLQAIRGLHSNSQFAKIGFVSQNCIEEAEEN